MPEYADLRENVTALVREFSVESSVDFKKNEGDDQKRTVEADWFLILRPHDNNGCTNGRDGLATGRREKVLTCTVEKQGRKWKITSLSPVSFFATTAE